MSEIPEPPELPPIPPEVLNPPPERVSLLESIRKAGGVGRCSLKSVRERKLGEPKRPPGGRGMDLMGDLRSNLRGRGGRGGMAGLRGGLRPSGRVLRK